MYLHYSGQGGGSIAIDVGAGNAKDNLKVWTSNVSATYASPVRYENKICVVSRGILTLVDANTGERLQQIRLKGAKKVGNARFGSLDYASPICRRRPFVLVERERPDVCISS